MTTAAPPRGPTAPPRGGTSTPAATPRTATSIGKPVAAFEAPRLIINAVEGWGKTSLGAFAPKPIILMARGETGYTTLLGSARVPQIDTVTDEAGKPRPIDSWGELISILDQIENSDYQTVILDAMGGFERLCHEYVCTRDFKGVWGDKGFGSFNKGYDLSVSEWLQLLVRMDKLKARGMTIVLLSHSKVKTVKNPVGPDYDKFISDVHEKTWAVTAKWADAVFTGKFFTIVEGGTTGERAKSGKGIGGSDRMLYVTEHDAWLSKNRYGMTEDIEMPKEPAAMWPTLWAAITANAVKEN